MHKILIIDDDHLTLQIYVTRLQSENNEVILCTDSSCALEQLKQKNDLILLDIMMPQIDGVQVLKQIKKGVNKNTPVLIHTNLLSEKTKKDCLENGASEYLIKADFTPNKLLEKIISYLPSSK